jgi:hypothetical protein
MKVKRLQLVHPQGAGSKLEFGLTRIHGLLSVTLWMVLAATTSVQAGTTDLSTSSASTAQSTRYGLFGWLDHRSEYGQGIFPEPFLVDDSDLETNEARLDWLHTHRNDQHSDQVTAEVEKGFGLLTLELEIPFERDVDAGSITQGVANIDLGARYPLYQYVSGNGAVDTTFGIAFEAGVPTNSSVSQNAEFVPKIFNDLKIGNHFTLQSVLGYSVLAGPGKDGGLRTFEYGFVFGYTFQHDELPVPGVQQFIPVAELSGETALNHEDRGESNLTADVGFRANLKTIGRIQPRLGVAFVFPLNETGRNDIHWGVVTSLVFEY